MPGLIGVGQSYRQQAEFGAEKASQLEVQRKQENQMADAAHKQNIGTMAGMGAAVGWAAGAEAGSVGGPWGMLIGAGVGALGGALM